jgi:hypothetical protein
VIDVLQSLLQSSLKSTPFATTSRYHALETATLELPDGRVVAYVRRRFLPPADRFTVIQEHVVRQGERLDQLAATYLGDPERFWQLCDANQVMWPPSLVEQPGGVVQITLPEGFAGSGHA